VHETRDGSVTQHPRLDPVGSIIFQTNYHDIQHVMVDGKFVKREGKLTKYDIGRLTRAAETSAAEIIDRVEAAQGPLQSLLGQGFAAIADERRSTFEQR